MKKLLSLLCALALVLSLGAAVLAEAVPAPGEAGFTEISIGEEQIVGPYQVAAVYFQAVDMYPANLNPTREESDMHMEADIHLTAEASKLYGFGEAEDTWPAYLTVKYEVAKEDGTLVTDGVFMPMNASDGPHYGANIKKDVIPVGTYKLKFIIEAPNQAYMLHTDAETGVEAQENAKDYFQNYEVVFDWNYTGEQLQNN